MRDRVFENTSTSANWQNYWWSVNNGYLYNSTKTHTSHTSESRMRDVLTANFHKRIARGEVINNPKLYFKRERVEEAALCQFIVTSSGGGHGQCGGYLSDHVTLTPFTGGLDGVDTYLDEIVGSDASVAISKAWANVNVSDAAALASMGELPENIRWIASLLNRVIQTIRFFKSKKKRLEVLKKYSKSDAVIDELSNLWLEFRYAIRPLAFEMKQAVNALHNSVEKGTRQTARGYDNETSYQTNNGSFNPGSTGVTANYSSTESYTLDYRAGVLFHIENDINGLLALWGIDQPMEAIWELTPFSFMIDWFFNIGHIISSWSYNSKLRPLASYVTVNYAHNVTATVDSMTVSGNNMAGPSGFGGNLIDKTIISRRFIDPSRPVIPTFNLKLDTSKLLDLATIGRGLYRSMW